MTRFVAAALILTIGAGPAGAAPPPRPITLEEALALAELNSPQMIQAQGNLRTSRAGVRSGYAAFIPSLSVSAGATRQLPATRATTRIENGQVITIPSEPWSFSDGVSANLELFDGGRRLQELKQARATVEAADAGETAARFDLALSVQEQFFAVLAAREAEAAAQSTMQQAGEQLRAAVARLRSGSGTRSDSLRSEIQLSNARLSLLTAQNDLTNASAGLTRVVGSTEPVTASDTGLPEPAALTLNDEELIRLAENGPAVRQAEAGWKQARTARRASGSASLPTLSAGYSYGGSGTDARFGLGEDPFSYRGALRFSLSYPIFNQLNREEQSIRATVAERNAEAALRDARLAARQNLTQYLGALRLSEERVAAQLTSTRSAEEDLRVQQQRYGLGVSTLLDLLTSQSQRSAAQDALIQARYDRRVARARLEALVGQAL